MNNPFSEMCLRGTKHNEITDIVFVSHFVRLLFMFVKMDELNKKLCPFQRSSDNLFDGRGFDVGPIVRSTFSSSDQHDAVRGSDGLGVTSTRSD